MLIFVSGPPRSGTTLLNGMLSGGAAYPMISECSLLTSIILNRLNYVVAKDPNRLRPYVRDDALLDSLCRNYVANILESLLSGFTDHREHLVLKDPYLTLLLPELHRFFDQPIRSVCAVRDPRAVVASLLEVMKRESGRHDLGAAIEALLPFYEGMAVAVGHQPLGHPILFVKYEDIVSGDVALLDKLEAFVGFEIDRNGYREVSEWAIRPGGPWHVPTYGAPVTDTRIGAYTETLTDEEIRRVEEAFATTMLHYGYATTERRDVQHQESLSGQNDGQSSEQVVSTELSDSADNTATTVV